MLICGLRPTISCISNVESKRPLCRGGEGETVQRLHLCRKRKLKQFPFFPISTSKWFYSVSKLAEKKHLAS